MMANHFTVLKKDSNSKARLGRLVTSHGVVETPCFMPVGTQGTVKAVLPRDLRETRLSDSPRQHLSSLSAAGA